MLGRNLIKLGGKMEITFNIPDEKLTRVVEAMKGLYPVPVDEDGVNLFTDNAWAKECVMNFIKRTVARYEQSKAVKELAYSEDNTLVE